MSTTIPAEDKHPPDSSELVLRIVSGLHVGASRPLSRREMVLIGSGDDCDVVLADDGVAAHHALLNVLDGRFHLRALDAPVELPGRTLHPGDPVEINQVQRIGLGHAAIAFGHADAPEWLQVAPETGLADGTRPPRPKVPLTSRLPMIAGIAVLALAALAIAAAMMPAKPPAVDVEHRLRQIARTHGVSDVSLGRGVGGEAVLSGTIADRAALGRLRAQLEAEALPASVNLRTGEDLAGDVGEVMRAAGYPVRAEYIGDDNVRVTGHLGGNQAAVNTFIQSRAVQETGVNRVETVNLDTPVADAEGAEPSTSDARVRIVAIVRGDQAHVVDADGEQYLPGDLVPGWGELVSIGQHAYVLQADGLLVKLVPQPAPPANAAAQDAPEAARPQASPRSGPAGSPAQAAPPMVQKPEKPVRPDLGLAGADMKQTSPAVNPRSRLSAGNIRYSPDRRGFLSRWHSRVLQYPVSLPQPVFPE